MRSIPVYAMFAFSVAAPDLFPPIFSHFFMPRVCVYIGGGLIAQEEEEKDWW